MVARRSLFTITVCSTAAPLACTTGVGADGRTSASAVTTSETGLSSATDDDEESPPETGDELQQLPDEPAQDTDPAVIQSFGVDGETMPAAVEDARFVELAAVVVDDTGWPAMRRELLAVVGLQLTACFVGGPGAADEAETETDTTSDDATDELGCLGCSCDEQAPCDPDLECATVCVPSSMVYVAPGPFPRGCDDEPCADDEAPQQMVALSAFAIDEHEVTVADYLACVTAKQGPCTLPELSWDGDDNSFNFGAPGREEHPVNGVTWGQAANDCARVGKRLPTEAEWEKAARGPQGERYPWGSSAPTCDRANLAIGGPGCGAGSTIATGQLAGGVSPVIGFRCARSIP